MKKINKIIIIVLIFMLIRVTLVQDFAYALRVPLGKEGGVLERQRETMREINRLFEEVVEDSEIRFATEKDARAVSRANNAAWKGNEALQVTTETASSRIGRDSHSCIISEMPGEGVVGVLWVARINTEGNLDPEVLWNRLTQGSPEPGSDTLICYAVGVIPEVSGKKVGGSVSTRLITEAKEVAAREGLQFVYTLSPTFRFEEFKNQYGKILEEALIPEKLWIYAYLISIKDGGPFPYLEYIKEHGYVSIRDYIKTTGNKLYCPTEGFHIIGNSAEIGIVLKGARPDCEYSIMYLYVDSEGGSAGIEKKIMEILQSYSGTNSFVSLNNVSIRIGL